MPPFDHEGALERAEKALHLGRIDAAIVEYVKVVEAQPRDWNSANVIGDLYVRANQPDDMSALLQSGDLNKARSSLSAATAGTDPALWNTLAKIELAAPSPPELRSLDQVFRGRSLLYDLAKTPELAGESFRALAVFVESESGRYRDVSGHIDRLSEVQARG